MSKSAKPRATVFTHPCPTCKTPNSLTAEQALLGLQCSDCATEDAEGRPHPKRPRK
jgi:hypothetical protein